MVNGKSKVKKSSILINSATTAGSSHKNAHGPGAINNHDAVWPIQVGEDVVGGVICDGCGSMPHSEIGAKLGAKAIADIIAEECEKNGPIDWEIVTKRAVEQIRKAATLHKSNSESLNDVIKNCFLFTVVIAVVRANKIIIAACGDGMYMHDDDIWDLDIPIENAPPYLAYKLISSKYDEYSDWLSICEMESISIEDVKKSVIIGSDGLSALASAKTSDLHHPIFMTDEKRLLLWLQAQVHSQKDVTLHDDVSLFILRPEEVQKKLFKKASALGDLKNQIIKLQRTVRDQKTEIVNLNSEVIDLTSDLSIERARNAPTLVGIGQNFLKGHFQNGKVRQPTGKVYQPARKVHQAHKPIVKVHQPAGKVKATGGKSNFGFGAKGGKGGNG